MISKKKAIMVSLILISSLLFINWDFSIGADNSEDESETVRNNLGFPLSTIMDKWSDIQVISEPVVGQNINTGFSGSLSDIDVVDDKIYVVWEDGNDTNGAGTDADIFYRHYDGSNWSDIQVISEPVSGLDINDQYSFDPEIVVDNGDIYVVWSDKSNISGAGDNNYDIFFRCNTTGTNWEPIQVVSEPVVGFDYSIGSFSPTIDIEENKIYVCWSCSNNTTGAGSNGDIFYRCNITGSNWEPIQVISEPVLGSDLFIGYCDCPDVVVENGSIYVVWHDDNETDGSGDDYDITFRCNISGNGWEDMQVISEPMPGQDLNFRNTAYPEMVVENGKIYVVFADSNATNSAGSDTDIFLRCNLTGTSWEPIQVISEPIPGQDLNTKDSNFPHIAVENDQIYIVWYDSNISDGCGSDKDIFFRYNLGAGWEPIQIISEPVKGNNLNTGVSNNPRIDTNLGKCHVVWSDNNDTDNSSSSDTDIHYRNLNLPAILNLPTVTPTIGDSGTYFNFTINYSEIENELPSQIRIGINNKNYQMYELDPGDLDVRDGKIYFCNITHFNIGTHAGTFSTSDGYYTTTLGVGIPITVENTKPVITTPNNETALEDTFYGVSYTYEDKDVANIGQIVKWLLNTNASWLSIEQVTGDLNGTPTNDDVGEYWVNLTINDTIDEVSTNFTLTVLNVNDGPQITTVDVTSATEDELYEVTYNAIDIDNTFGELNWILVSNATWLALNASSAILSGTPGNDDVGEYWVNISVNDGEYSDYSNFSLTVIGVNDAPVIITTDVTSVLEDAKYKVDYEALDIDNLEAELNWSIETNAKWLDFNLSTAVLNGTPTNEYVGTYWVNISVQDAQYIDFTNFTVTVENTNDPPEIITEDKLLAIIDKVYLVNYEAIDIDPHTTTFTWSLQTTATDWLSIDTSSGLLNGIPTQVHLGDYSLNVSVSDGEGGFDFHNFTLSVKVPNLNPVIQGPYQNTTKVNIEYMIQYSATDDRTELLNFVWTLNTNASWLTFDPGSRTLSGIPNENETGIYWVNITVLDEEDGSDYRNFTISVQLELNSAPEFSNGNMSPESGDTETEFTFTVHYSDADGDAPETIQVVIDDKAYDMNLISGEAHDGEYELKIKLEEGEHSYYFTANDGINDAVTIDSTPTSSDDARNTPSITKHEPSKKEKGPGDWMLYLILIIIIIIVLLVIGLVMKGRKPDEEAPAEEEEMPEEELEGEEPEGEAFESERLEEEIQEEEWKLVDEEPIIEAEESVEPEMEGKIADMEIEPAGGMVKKEAEIIIPKKVKVLKTPKKPKKPKEIEEELEIESKKIVTGELIEPKMVKLEDKSIPCSICLGIIKTGLMALKCQCGKYYHESCGIRVGECPKCSRKFKLEKLAKLKKDEMETLEELEESELPPKQFEKKMEVEEKAKREKFAEIISGLEERLAKGEISEETYLMLRTKYENK